MAEFELHADYDRDGRLTTSASEYALRSRAPGAILVPNLDVDARALPTTVAPGPRLTLDGQQPVALAGDDEQLPLLVRVKGPVDPGTQLFLRPVGFPKIRLRVNDARGRMLPRDLRRGDDLPIALPAKAGDLRFTVSTHTLPGAPYGRVTDLNALYSASATDESSFTLQLVVVNLANQESIADEGHFTIAPFIVLGHDATVLRVYVADDGQNAATLAELEPALQASGVLLVKVPPLPAVNEAAPTNDTWLQDQFQPAVVQGVGGWRHVMVHLPRNRTDTYSPASAANLARFVVSHFPARNVGLFDDLWDRELQVFDANRQQHKLSFGDALVVAAAMDAVSRLLTRLHEALSPVNTTVTDALSRNWPTSFTGQLTALAKLDAVLRALPPPPPKTPADEQASRKRTIQYYRDAYDRLLSRFLYAGPQSPWIQMPVGRENWRLTPDAADRLHRRLTQIRSSSNYGGNLEATPPMADAPLGKLLIGNVILVSQSDGADAQDAASDQFDFMDPDVLTLLMQQRKQPIVSLDTQWLEVGHVDEILSVVPDGNGAAGFAFLRASPALAVELLTRARDRYLAGLATADRASWVDEPSGVLDRLMIKGQSPVTRLMRGKTWLHLHPQSAPDQAANILEPPLVFQKLSAVMNGSDLKDPTGGSVNVHGIRYWPGEGPERHYAADITVAELLYCEQDNRRASTNRGLGSGRSAGVDKTLSGHFRDVRRLPLPVLFDRVANVASPFLQTGAVTPNVVNMLVIGKTLMIPRPYGPRMRLVDASVVIAEAMSAQGLPASLARRVDAGFVGKHGLGRGVYWIERQKRLDRPFGSPSPYSGTQTTTPFYEGLESDKDVIKQFADSFPGADDDTLRKNIIAPNQREFDALGNLKAGSRRFVIEDGWVDLFEAAILAVTDELGLTVAWIDSWFYHLRHGEIHCGTNVLRTPPKLKTPVWSVPNTAQGPHGMEFSEFDGLKL